MPQATGSNARFAFVEEVTAGTTPGTPAMKLLNALTTGEGLSASIEELRSNAISPDRAVIATRGGNKTVGGSVPFELPLLGIGTLLKHALGTVSTTGAGPYTHVIKRDALLPGLSVEKGFTDINQFFVYRGCRINTLDFAVANSGLITGSMAIEGLSAADPSGTELGVPTSTTHDPFVHHEAVFEEGGTGTALRGLTAQVTNNLQTDNWNVGNQDRVSLPEGVGETTGTATYLFEDLTHYNKWKNETESTLKITFTAAGGSIEFFWPKVKYTGEAAPKIDTEQGILIPMNFRGLWDDTEQTDLRITIINTETTI